MELWAFSVSLAVKDIEASKDFYEKLGFTMFAGEEEQGWLIMKNGEHIVGLFQGMFEKNLLTFNPGWNQDAETLDSFSDVSLNIVSDEIHNTGVFPHVIHAWTPAHFTSLTQLAPQQ